MKNSKKRSRIHIEEEYNERRLKKNINTIRREGHLSYVNVDNLKIKGVGKKIIKKAVAFIMVPLIDRQNHINLAVAEAVNDIYLYAKKRWSWDTFDKMDEEIHRLEEKVCRLEDKIESLTSSEAADDKK